MKRPLLLGLAVTAGAAIVGSLTSTLLGSRPDGVGADGPLAPCGPGLNCYRSRRAVAGSPAAALDAAEAYLRDDASGLTGRVLTVERTADGVRAVVQLGPFRDDMTVAAEARDDDGSLLYVRSASRVGRSDAGINRLRGRRLLDAVAAALEPDDDAS